MSDEDLEALCKLTPEQFQEMYEASKMGKDGGGGMGSGAFGNHDDEERKIKVAEVPRVLPEEKIMDAKSAAARLKIVQDGMAIEACSKIIVLAKVALDKAINAGERRVVCSVPLNISIGLERAMGELSALGYTSVSGGGEGDVTCDDPTVTLRFTIPAVE